MNERIKLLADQAGLYASEQYPGSFVKYDPKWFEFYNKKFAELIVRECVDIVEGRGFLHEQAPDAIFAGECSSAIKRHLGVK